MIISASRRTDIPAYYADWFFNRIREKFVYVRNPMNPHQISEVPLSPEVVDGMVFWTKNPLPMLGRLDELRDYPYYFQFTLTPYSTDIEKNLPSKNEVLIPAFQKLSSMIGRQAVVWRYDPILLSPRYTMAYHIKYFRLLCDRLADYTEKCTISFLDLYRNIDRRISALGITAPSSQQMDELAACFSEIAKQHGIYLDTCAEEVNLGRYGIRHASCIDRERLERIGNYTLDIGKDTGQRAACGCIASIDIGGYNTCKNGCVYCYANFNQILVENCCAGHHPDSPLLYGKISADDRIIPRKVKSYRNSQLNLF